MITVVSLKDLRLKRGLWTAEVAFVPTMGNLHAGHIQLVKEAKSLAKHVVVSVFVNPLQFGENEDFSTYPRTLDEDKQKLIAAGADLLFLPTVETIYPETIAVHTQVSVPKISESLCGASRPGHFTGVATIVAKLFNMVQPTIALFGKKDYQQLAVIKKMVNDLAIPIKIHGIDTVREGDGLAMSSRNGYLTALQRQQAPLLFQLLQQTKEKIQKASDDDGETFINSIKKVEDIISESVFELDYFDIRRQQDLQPVDEKDKKLVLLIAAKLGSTRLIDNLEINL